MRDRLRNFMYGRNGFDQLGRFLTYVVLGLIIASFFVRFLSWIAIILIVYIYFRAFSRDIYRRQRENEAFLSLGAKIKNFFTGKRDYSRRNAGYKIFDCPSCRQKIRIPKGKGRIEISCPKCRTKFIRKS